MVLDGRPRTGALRHRSFRIVVEEHHLPYVDAVGIDVLLPGGNHEANLPAFLELLLMLYTSDLSLPSEQSPQPVVARERLRARYGAKRGAGSCRHPVHPAYRSASHEPGGKRTACSYSQRSFAIWTALVAAPLRIWSPQHQKVMPRATSGLEISRRRRPTQIKSWSEVSMGMG